MITDDVYTVQIVDMEIWHTEQLVVNRSDQLDILHYQDHKMGYKMLHQLACTLHNVILSNIAPQHKDLLLELT